MEEYAVSLQFTGSEEEKNKKILDFIMRKLRILTLKRAYMVMVMPNQTPFKSKEVSDFFFKIYQMRILVPAIKIYQHQGSKGSAHICNV